MKFTAVAALAAIGAVASPVAKRAPTYTDVDVLKYALTLEHLEKQFYTDALNMFSQQDFQNAGYPDWVRGRISQIQQHESSHVALLSAALGNMSIPACTYNFGLSSPADFILKAAFIENLGVSAYAGANQYISTPLYSTVAATILSVEARHSGFLTGPVLKRNDWTGPYDTPLGLNMVYTLAAQFITSCPANASLPLYAATPLLSGGAPIVRAAAGSMVPVTYSKSSSSVAGPVNAFIYNGLGSKQITYANGNITLPSDIQGYSYVILANADSPTSVTWMNTVAGPLEVGSPFDASVSNPGFMNPFNS